MKRAIIIGAGPAGLTAAYELLKRSDIIPVIYEATDRIGGISQTVVYKGNRMDIGGHRFFSKSDRVMDFWKEIMPVQYPENHYADKNDDIEENIFLIRQRLSRILFLKRFFDYPIKINVKTIANLGIIRIFHIGMSYLWNKVFPVKPEKSLEDFYINRFGGELYRIFFRDYTEKVWGVPCREIPSDWGTQRVKGLSVGKALMQNLRFTGDKKSIEQKHRETSLIERFLYPKYGPGQFWERLAGIIRERGGEIYLNHEFTGSCLSGKRISEIKVMDKSKNILIKDEPDYFFSTMPVKHLLSTMEGLVPDNVVEVADGLIYRDFMTIGLLLKDILVNEDDGSPLKDNWIYVQERQVKVGRLQIFNNWSPYMIKDKDKIFLGMEYFVNEGDELWKMKDHEFAEYAVNELSMIGFIKKDFVIDYNVIRIPKAYPAYFGTYDRLDEIIDFTGGISNLYMIGRNGMHKYNNSDHSSLSAMIAVDNIINGISDKSNIWKVNTEQEYHEGS